MKQQISVGLDIGSAMTKVVVVEHGSDGTFHILGSAKTETKGGKQSYVISKSELTKTIKTLIQEAKRN